MVVYILEWGIDIRCTSTVQFANTIIFSTLEDAVSIAMEYESSIIPNIVKYDLTTHRVIKEYTDIPALDTEIGAI